MNNFEKSINAFKFSRKAFMSIINSCSLEELNKIPEGYNNNIIWNFAHSLVTAEHFCYRLSGNKCDIPSELAHKYVRGTKPESPIDEKELAFWKELGNSSITQLEEDYEKGLFDNYNSFDFTPNTRIEDIIDALYFCVFHEGTHFGYAMALKRSL